MYVIRVCLPVDDSMLSFCVCMYDRHLHGLGLLDISVSSHGPPQTLSQAAGAESSYGCAVDGAHIRCVRTHFLIHDGKDEDDDDEMLWFEGVTSWLSLVFPNLEWLFGFLRDAYEAYAVTTVPQALPLPLPLPP